MSEVDRRAKGFGRKIAGLALAVVCFGVVLLLMRIPMFVDYSEVETIGAETYIGWPIPWKTSAPYCPPGGEALKLTRSVTTVATCFASSASPRWI